MNDKIKKDEFNGPYWGLPVKFDEIDQEYLSMARESINEIYERESEKTETYGE